MSRRCPISLKGWDIYGACTEQLRDIVIFRYVCLKPPHLFAGCVRDNWIFRKA